MSTAEACNSECPSISSSSISSNPLVVALLYNQNGMASWCWEAAHALHELGRSVLLVAALDVPLPGTPEVEVVRIDIAARSAQRRIGIGKALSSARSLLGAGPDGLLQRIHADLAARGVQPSGYIVNQSTLVDPSVACPQLVAAWAYPIELLAYLRKIPLIVPDKSFKSFVRTALSSTGWWRRDWRAYRSADRTLPVTEALLKSLRRRSVSCHLVYPGTCVGPVAYRPGDGIKLLMAAANLADSRKRIVWMLEAMKEMCPPSGVVLQLAGEPDDTVRRAAAAISFPVEFLGHLKRQELQLVMQKADVFCFGSLLDDWGYVLVEAMANGMVPVAPAISPFDEILYGVGSCYSQLRPGDFIRVLSSVISSDLSHHGRQARDRAQALFSRQAFGRAILASIKSVAPDA
jgi:glycosyltransferase involved in cell wall biosynthesis